MKRTILPLLMVVSGALMLGCKDFDCCGPGVISTNPSALTIGGFIGASQDLVVNCPMAWTITDLPDWLIAEPDRGDFGGPVSLKATQGNPPGADPRSATITFMAANGDKMRVTITQSAQEVYTVTPNLTDLTRSNPATAALQGEAYSTVFTADAGYELPAAITVTMGGVLLTEGVEYDYDNATGNFTVAHVTGDLVITATGTLQGITVTAIIMTATLYGDLDTPAAVTSTSDITEAELDALIALEANRVITGWYTTDNPNGTKAVFPITATTTLYVRLNGNGISNAAPVEIVNAAELAALSTRINAGSEPPNLHYKLIADIDLGGYQGGEGWTPIGNSTTGRRFTGRFDGAGLKVTGLFINTSIENTGLFGFIRDGSVQNLGVEIAAGGITGGDNTGGVAGQVFNGSISNCYVTGNVSGSDLVGGVAGSASNSSTSNCYFAGNVSGNIGVGGIAGGVFGSSSDISSVSNCYAAGNVSGNDYVGGVAGNHNAGRMTNCAAFNTSITRTSGAGPNFGRVVGAVSVVSILANNVARDNMTASNVSFPAGQYTANGFNGLDVNATTLQTTYTGLGWLFNDSTPAGPWIWDAAGFPKLGFGPETNPF